MAMLHKKDLPTYYDLVTAHGEIVGTAAKSKVFALKKQLETERGETLEIKLRGES